MTRRELNRRKPARSELKPGQCLCDFCTGKCCRYFSLPIDTPHTWDDYDSIRWYLAHGQTVVYVLKEQWYLLVKTVCKYLSDDNRCRIYLNRPKICRDYTTEDCEYDDEWSFHKLFETPEQIWEYAEALLRPRRKRPSPPGSGLPVITLAGGDPASIG
jgi:Fe-S-cluster containining protein